MHHKRATLCRGYNPWTAPEDPYLLSVMTVAGCELEMAHSKSWIYSGNMVIFHIVFCMFARGYYTVLYAGMNISKSQFCVCEAMPQFFFASAVPLAAAAGVRLGACRTRCCIMVRLWKYLAYLSILVIFFWNWWEVDGTAVFFGAHDEGISNTGP